MRKVLMIIGGLFSLILGVIGILVPGLPTTPFLLLTAALFLRSSDLLYNWLIDNKHLGKYVLNYQRRNGMTRQQKVYSISLMWIMIVISAGLLIKSTPIRLIIVAAGVVGTVVMGFVVPNVSEND
ncbi:MAG TPA: YbaN family protein [Prolixibacteraceae bacterium]|nr:YbaN family protein [Prolixibacteraceae bacterium]